MTARGSAIRYARALFDVGLQEGVDLESLQRELSSFSQLMSEHESLQRALVNPAIPASKKRAVVEALSGRVDPARRWRGCCCCWRTATGWR